MKIESRYTAEEEQRMHERLEYAIEQSYNKEEQQEVRDFVEKLEKRIEGSREVFFWSADNTHERRQNEEVRDKEKKGESNFNYGSAIHMLILSLSSIDVKKRREIMKEICSDINFKITGIYVDRPKDIPGHHTAPLLTDLASSPLEYLN